MEQKKAKGLHSIRVQIILLNFVAVLVTSVFMIFTYAPKAKENMTEINENYMMDLAISYGAQLDIKMVENGGAMPGADALKNFFSGKGLRGMDTSNTFLCDTKGNLMFHKDMSLIGTALAAGPLQDTVTEMGRGAIVDTRITRYTENGTKKLASVYAEPAHGFVVCVVVDEAEIMASTNEINVRGYILFAVLLVAFNIVGYFTARGIIRPLIKTVDKISKLSKLDFTTFSGDKYLSGKKGEVGEIYNALELLKGSLVKVVTEITEQSNVILATAEKLTEGTERTGDSMEQVEIAVNEISTGANSQAEDTQTATENVVVMGNMIADMNEEMEALQGYSKEMEESEKFARDIFIKLETINKQARENVISVAEQTKKTNKSVENIQQAVDIITSIAEETNLLSLNASIEAARAGEQGRGFAVVASQIQKLAEQSNASAGEIVAVVDVLLKESDETVKIMEQVQDIIQEQTVYVEKSNEAFEKIRTSLDHSAQGMKAIVDRTEQLNDNRNKVVDVVQNLSAIAEENAAGAEETNASVSEVTEIVNNIARQAEVLNNIADSLKANMDQFKVKENTEEAAPETEQNLVFEAIESAE